MRFELTTPTLATAGHLAVNQVLRLRPCVNGVSEWRAATILRYHLEARAAAGMKSKLGVESVRYPLVQVLYRQGTPVGGCYDYRPESAHADAPTSHSGDAPTWA